MNALENSSFATAKFSNQKVFRLAFVAVWLFPMTAILAATFQSKIEVSFLNVFSLILHSPLQWLIIAFSLFVGIQLIFLKKSVKRIENSLSQEREKSTEQEHKIISFMCDLEKGDFGQNYEFASTQLTELLASLKVKLVNQKEEDQRARWTSEGISKFGEILRASNNVSSLCNDFVKGIVKYVNLNQGSVFLCQNDELKQTTLELRGCYAYNRKKYLDKTIKPGEDLVGQCFLENETIILKKVPAHYLHITSGLGEATPRFVAIIPIKANDVTEGVLEIAGFKELKDFEIKFIEKVCEAFASVIRSIKSNEETRTLLEATRKQTEQLQSQEEEIRQNMEEMIATQEQLTRQLEENKTIRERVERRERVMALTTILSETDPYGTITYVNDKFCEVSKYSVDELVGKPQNIVRHPDMPKQLFELFWKTIKRGEVFRGIIKNKAKDGSAYWVDATIVPVLDHDGHIVKYTGSRYHITDEELAVRLYNKQADAHQWPRLPYGGDISLPIHERMPISIFG